MALFLLPCAVELGRICGWTPGAASLLLLMIPVCLASFSERPWGLTLTTLVAAGSSLSEGYLVTPSLDEFLETQSFPLVASGMLLLIGPLMRQLVRLKHHVETIHTSPAQLHEHAHFTEQAPTSFNAADETDLPSLTPEPPIPATSISELLLQTELKSSPDAKSLAPVHDTAESDDPQLLLTLQEVGWRVATDFDLSTLYQTVRHTTQRILRCRCCSVLLWNSQNSTLVDALRDPDGDETPAPYPVRGMLGWVTKNRNLLIRADVENDPAMKYLQRREESHIEAIVPLTAGGELLGVLTLEGVNASTPQFRRMLQLLANVSALAIKNARLFQRIAEMARRDGLTGLLNHASFQERLRELVDKAQCQQLPLTVIMSDVDRFKSINDSYGHPVGDHVLREVARIWRTVVPEYALSARYGGEEFICAVPGMELDRATDLAESLRQTLETLPLSFEGGVLNVTASFGVAQLGLPARNATELVRLVDEALYQSKHSGRNRVTVVPAQVHTERLKRVPR